MFSPFMQSTSLTFISDIDRVASIARLSVAMNPLAIAGLVIAIYIFTFNRMLFAGGFAHIGKKILEVVPSLAYLDSASAVVFENLQFGIPTAPSHSFPDAILKSLAQTMLSVAVVPVEFSTPAAFRISGFQIGRPYDRFVSAIALALVKFQRMRPAPPSKLDHNQSTKSFSS